MTVFLLLVLLVSVIVLFAQIRRLSQKLKYLDGEFYTFKQRFASESPHIAPVNVEKPLRTVQKDKSQSREEHKEKSRPVYQVATPPKPVRSRSEWEALIGGKYLNRIGAVALILGAGFFLKSAYDNNWFSESVRVIIVAVYGLLLIQIGTRLYQKARIFAQGVIGTGISVLYLSVYASFNYYQLVSQIIAFVLLLVITAMAFYYALKYESLAVALLGWFGGYVSPLFLQADIPNELNLFLYLLITSVGILAIVYKNRTWFALEPLVLSSVFVHFLYWYFSHFSTDKFLIALVFVSVIWLLFYLNELVTILKDVSRFPVYRYFVSYLNVSLFYISLYLLMEKCHPGWTGRVTLFLAIIYFLTSLGIRKIRPAAKEHIFQQHLSAIVLLILATAIQYTGYTTVVLWSLEALLLTSFAVRFKLKYVWVCSLLLYGILLFKLVIIEYLFKDHFFSRLDIEGYNFLFNLQDFAFLFTLFCLGVSRVVFKTESKEGNFYRFFLEYGFAILFLIFCTVETDDFMTWYTSTADQKYVPVIKNYRLLILSVVWFIYSLPTVCYGLRFKKISLMSTGLIVLLISHFIALPQILQGFAPVEKFILLLNIRALTLVTFAAGLFFYVFYLRRHTQKYWFIDSVLVAVRYVLIFLLFALISVEIRDFFARKLFFLQQTPDIPNFQNTVERLKNLEQLFLSAVWIMYAIILLFLGIWRKITYLRTVAFILLGLCIAKIFIFDLSYLKTSFRFILFIGLGMILLGVSYLYQRQKNFLEGKQNNSAP
ncbi:DUF2339 domain-containing protein [candidate division KSB1 bacterium]|nr:DUF2339 domain-containing protein [candidate division KSB1 bacterium]